MTEKTEMSPRKFGKKVSAACKELNEYERGHKLSRRAMARFQDARDALARARYGKPGSTEAALAVIAALEKDGARAIAYRNIPGVTRR